jgi:hypothetical protein
LEIHFFKIGNGNKTKYTMDNDQDDRVFQGLVLLNLIGGVITLLRAQYGDVTPLFIWAINCGLLSVAGTIIEG